MKRVNKLRNIKPSEVKPSEVKAPKVKEYYCIKTEKGTHIFHNCGEDGINYTYENNYNSDVYVEMRVKSHFYRIEYSGYNVYILKDNKCAFIVTESLSFIEVLNLIVTNRVRYFKKDGHFEYFINYTSPSDKDKEDLVKQLKLNMKFY